MLRGGKMCSKREKPAAHLDSMLRKKGCLHAQLQADIAHGKHNVPGIPHASQESGATGTSRREKDMLKSTRIGNILAKRGHC